MIGTFLTAEMACLATATLWPRGEVERDRLAELALVGLNMPLLARLARRHHVSALVASAVPACPIPTPAGLLAKGLRLARETARLSALLEAAGVQVTVLKGAATALSAFGQIGFREALDIDLLVPPDHVEAAMRVLQDCGYRADAPPAARDKDIALHHAETAMIVELHWRLFQNPRVLDDAAQSTRRMEMLPGYPVSVLDPLIEALYLCCHGGEHGWERLKWLADISALIRGGHVDIDVLYDEARQRRLSRMVGPGLLLAHRVYGTPLPPALARDLKRDWRMRRLADVAWDCLAGAEDGAELLDREGAVTRKNLSHYLFSADPRRLWHEARHDLFDGPLGEPFGARVLRVLGRFYRPMRRTA